MTSEQKVKQVYHDAVVFQGIYTTQIWATPYGKRKAVCMVSNRGHNTKGAWADAWRRIQSQRKAATAEEEK
jgi:hypothetical protein